MPKTGGHFESCNVGSVEAHNERTQAYLDGVKAAGLPFYFFHNLTPNNTHWVNDGCQEFAGKTCSQIFEFLKQLYTEKFRQAPNLKKRTRINKKTGKEYTVEGWNPIREAVIPIKEDTTVEDFKDVIAWLKKHGIEVIRIDLHKDEGYKDEKTGEVNMNYHAHLVGCWVNLQTGKTANLKNDKMSEFNQKVLPDALGMEAGIPKAITGKEHLSPSVQRTKAEIERLQGKANALEQEIEEMQKKVGPGASFLNFFGVGKEADIRRKWEKAEEDKAQAVKDKNTAQKALQDAKEAHAKELVAEKEKGRQEGYKKAISEVEKAANLPIIGKDGKETAQDIGKAWRSEFNQRENLEQELQKARGKDQVWERSINRFLYHLGIDEKINYKGIEEANKMFDAGITQGRDWMRRGRWRLCKAICAWSVEYDNFLASPSQKALQSLLRWYRTMKEAWEALLSQARMMLQLSTPQNDLLKMVNRQLNFTPIPGVEYINDWKGALDMGEEKYLTSLQKNVEEEGKRKEFMKQQEEYRKQQEEDGGIEEETQSRGWHV